MWQWWNCLEEQVALPRKVLRVNVDETAVRFYMPQRKSHTKAVQATHSNLLCMLPGAVHKNVSDGGAPSPLPLLDQEGPKENPCDGP